MSPDPYRLVSLDDQQTVSFLTALTIGRHPLNNLVVDLPEVSSRHAQIEWRDGVCAIRDLGSSNGTTVNGRRILDWRPLSVGDVLRIAGTRAWRVDALHPPAAAVDYRETQQLKASPADDLVLELQTTLRGEGTVRLLRRAEGGERCLGEAQAGQGFTLLLVLARNPATWVPDADLRVGLWGRRAPRMARSGLHTLLGNTRKLLSSLGAEGELLEKGRGCTRLALPAERVRLL